MSHTTPELTAEERRRQRRGRIMGALICLTVLLPMTVAYGIFYTGIGMPATTVNKGVLLDPPQAVDDLALHDLDAAPWDFTVQRKQWRWVIPGAADCNVQCQDNLYLTRQVHIRLAEKSMRVERIYLLLDDHLNAATEQFLQSEHPHIQILKADPATLQRALSAANVAGDVLTNGHYYLMDQDGFLMMAYTPNHTGQELLDDIKRMLKYSYEE
jgi:hypothetical protein